MVKRFMQLVATEYLKAMESTKKIGRMVVSEEDIRKILSMICDINALDEFATTLHNTDLAVYEVPSVFVPFIQPKSLRMEVGNYRLPDLLLSREDWNLAKSVDEENSFYVPYTLLDITEIYGKMIQSVKGADIHLVSVVSIRDHQSLQSMFPKKLVYLNSSVDEMVVYDDAVAEPLPCVMIKETVGRNILPVSGTYQTQFELWLSTIKSGGSFLTVDLRPKQQLQQ